MNEWRRIQSNRRERQVFRVIRGIMFDPFIRHLVYQSTDHVLDGLSSWSGYWLRICAIVYLSKEYFGKHIFVCCVYWGSLICVVIPRPSRLNTISLLILCGSRDSEGITHRMIISSQEEKWLKNSKNCSACRQKQKTTEEPEWGGGAINWLIVWHN